MLNAYCTSSSLLEVCLLQGDNAKMLPRGFTKSSTEFPDWQASLCVSVQNLIVPLTHEIHVSLKLSFALSVSSDP